MPAHRLPPFYLPSVFSKDSSPHIVSAIPLEPPTWVIFVDPPLLLPHRKWLTRIDTKVIESAILSPLCKLGSGKPTFRKLCSLIAHVNSAEHTELEHFLGSELGLKLRIKVLPLGLRTFVHIAPLYFIPHMHHPPHVATACTKHKRLVSLCAKRGVYSQMFRL